MKKQEEKASFIEIRLDSITLEGNLVIPENPIGIVLFAHGSGSSRTSTRNRFVASLLNENGIATLLFDLLTSKEEEVDLVTASYRFNISLLADRLVLVTDWIKENKSTSGMKIAYFGASTGAAAAIVAASKRPHVKTIVSRGGRPDLAQSFLSAIKCPVLLIVGGYDFEVIELNRIALEKIKSEKKLTIIPESTHLFEEKGKLQEVAEKASEWFLKYLRQ